MRMDWRCVNEIFFLSLSYGPHDNYARVAKLTSRTRILSICLCRMRSLFVKPRDRIRCLCRSRCMHATTHTHTYTGLSSGNRGSAFVWIRAERLVRPGLCILHCGRPWTPEYRTGIGRREVTQKSRRDGIIGHSPRNKQTFSHNHTNNA